MGLLINHGSAALYQVMNAYLNIIHQQRVQNVLFAVEILINSRFCYPGPFGNFVDAGFMITEFAEQILRGAFNTVFYFVGFHVSVRRKYSELVNESMVDSPWTIVKSELV